MATFIDRLEVTSPARATLRLRLDARARAHTQAERNASACTLKHRAPDALGLLVILVVVLVCAERGKRLGQKAESSARRDAA